MRSLKCVWFVGALAVLTPGVLMGRSHSMPVTNRSQVGYASPEGRELLNQIAERASAIQNTIGPLDRETRFDKADSWTESSALNDVRDEVNSMGKDLRRLSDLRAQLAPWQQRELDRITPLAVALARTTRDAIRTFDQNIDHTWTTQLPKDLTTMSECANEIDSSVKETTKVAKLDQEIDRLKHKS